MQMHQRIRFFSNRALRVWVLLVIVITMLLNHGIARGNTLTVAANLRGGALKKAGLGSLFGIVTNNTGGWKYYLTNSFLYVSEHQTRIGEGTTIPSSTSAVAPLIRGTKIK